MYMRNIWKKIKNTAIKTWKVLDAQYEFIEYVGEGLIGLGLGHKAVKTKTVTDAIKRAQSSMNNKNGKNPKI